MKLNIKLEGLLYNNDKDALEEAIKYDKKYKIFENKVKRSEVNNFELEIEKDDMIDTLLKKLNIKLFEKIEYKNKEDKHCLYCFKNHKKNEIIDFTKKVDKNKELKELLGFDDEEDLDLDLDIDFEDFDLDEEEEDNIYGGSKGKNKKQKIFVCYNCMKIYYFNEYYKIEKTYKDIFPYTDLFYLFVNDITLPYNYYLKNNKKKVYDLNIPKNPLDDIEKVNYKYIKNNPILDLDKNILKEKYILNSNSFEIVEKILTKDNKCNLELINQKKVEINFIYFPETCMYYKNNKHMNIDVYLKLYFPFISMKSYYEHFYNDKFTTNQDIRGKEEIDYTIEKNYLNWVNKFESNIVNYKLFDNIKEYKKSQKYISKIFYEVFDEKNKDLDIINFKNIIHLIDVDEKLVYINIYNPLNNKYIKKIYKEKDEFIKNKNWNMSSTDIIQFKLLLPYQKKEYYININMYKNTKINITISLPIDSKIYITKENINEINDYINKNFIERLNKKNIFNYNFKNFKIKKINIHSDVCSDFINYNNYNIHTINFYMNIGEEIELAEINDKIYNLEKCLSLYYKIDENSNKTDMRYIRNKNISMGTIIDKIIYETYTNFSINESNLNNEIINKIMKKFNLSYNISKQYLDTYTYLYKNFQIKPLDQGIYLSFIESDNNILFSSMGCRSYDIVDKISIFMYKYTKLLKEVITNKIRNENIKKISDNCLVNKEYNKLIFNSDKTTLKQIEKFKCQIDLNNEKNNTMKKKINKRINNLDKSIKEDIIIFSKKNKKSVKYITRLQDSFKNLKFKENTNEESKSNEDKNYSKQCQKSRQPMGTGVGYPPEIIDFDKVHELKRFEIFQNMKCNLSKKGGSKKLVPRFDDYYMNWGIENNIKKYPNKMNILKCGIKNEENYKRGDLIKISKELGIKLPKKYDKKVTCNNIRKKISENYKEYLEKNIKLLENKLKDKLLHKNQIEKIEDMLDDLEFKLYHKYTKYLNNIIDIPNKDIINISKKLKFKNASRMNKNVFKELIVKYIFIDKFDNEKINKMMEIIELDEKINEFLEITSIITRIQYEVYKLFSSWDNKSIEIMNENFKWKTGKTLKEKIYNYEKNYIDFLSFDRNENNNYMNEIEQISSKINLLLNIDTNKNKIIQSTLNFKGKAISCPNFESQSVDHNLVGFLDIPVSLIPKNMSENEIRNKYCKPCCFKANFDKNEELIIQSNYKRNNLFCTKKMGWEDYLNDLDKSKKIDNYITSFSNKYNLKNTFSLLPYNLNNLFNNYINLFNIINKKFEEDNIFENYTNNILKSPGFVLTGNTNIEYSFKDSLNLVFKDYDYIKEIKEKLTDNIFITLNQGDLTLKFKTKEKYIKYLEGKEISYDNIVDILSRKNIFTKYKTGINLFIFTEENENTKLLEFPSLNINQIDKKKSKIFLYKYDNEVYEPIIFFNQMKYISVFDKKTIENTKYIKNKKVFNSLMDFISDWYLETFIPTYITIDELIEIYGLKNIKYQIIDSYYKVLFIILRSKNNENDILLPVHPQGFNTNIKTLEYKNIKKYIKFIKNLEYDIKEYSKKIDEPDFKIKSIFVDNNYIEAVELKNDLIIPVIKQKYNKSIKYPISKNINYLKINDIIKNGRGILNNNFEEIINNYEDELYKTFRLFVSNKLTEKEINKIKKIIIDLDKLKSDKMNIIDIDKYYNKIKNIIIELLVKSINYVGNNHNIDRFIVNNNNIRENCIKLNKNKCSTSTFCSLNNNKCSINIPKSKKNIFINYITNDILNNKQISDFILNKNIDVIIDNNKFESSDKHKIIIDN